MSRPSKAPVISVRALSKAYGSSWRARLGSARHSESWVALQPLDLELAAGSSLAVLGRNGAGKSSFLRLLAGTAQPTEGGVRVRGRAGLLLDLGGGLVDDWTGEENAVASLRLRGAPKEDDSLTLQAIRLFADLGRFFDRPVRTYSSGMRMRLAYALAVSPEPELLIADEVLAVGDEGFQRRCAVHIEGFLARGGTLVLATHSLYLAEKLCTRALWLDRGHARLLGACNEVTRAYRDSMRVGAETPSARERSARGALRLASMGGSDSLASEQENGPVRVRAGEPLEVLVRGGSGHLCVVRVEKPDGRLVARFQVGKSGGRLRLETRDLLPGAYRLRLASAAAGPDGQASSLDELWLDCVGMSRELGVARLPHRWAVGRSAPA